MLIPLKHNNQIFYIDVEFAVEDFWGDKQEIDVNWRSIDDKEIYV
jgi:hypothetical protein